ncbi:MAG: ABC transporter permease [Chloroflexi bacterium]|nr:MAG: ABC transporter permease [Chloroflexota bacterium]MBL1193465.1 ABC transporter permease [Chloroflexota bacterium]NOH10756.1 ABC transporter permease [Chloroflexota bacterium]
MNESEFVLVLASIFLQASPLMIAVAGEALTERAGVVNLSLDGSMLMSAMTGFVVAYTTDNIWLGFLAAALVGAFFALIVAFGSIYLKQSQVAIGFVLTLLGDDLSAFLGQNFVRLPGPSFSKFTIPLLSEIPILGPIFFDQNVIFYFAVILALVTYWWLFRTQPGLHLRASGERPDAAFARGVNVNRVRYLYTVLGGALVGIAGASYSLAIKIGWSDGHTRGFGWIALAIVIFGGWSPIRGAVGAVLFGATKAMATYLQRAFPEVSVVAFNSIPWILMIAVLLVVGSDFTERFTAILPKPLQGPVRQLLRVAPPMALGNTFGEDP